MSAPDRRTKVEKLADEARTSAASTSTRVRPQDVRRKWEQVALIKKGGFDDQTALFALCTHDSETKDAVALWLRGELNKLRDSKTATLARVEIADLAITMLEQLADGFDWIGENLLSLLRELLEVDRHRRKIVPNPKLRMAAMIDGMALESGEVIGVRELARRVSVRPRAIVEWRRSAIYHKEISRGSLASPSAIARIFANHSKKYDNRVKSRRGSGFE
jgi:hypothetical protein